MPKPVTMCDELGCTREWTVILPQYGQPTLSPKASTAMNLKLCDHCVEQRQRALPYEA